jgi:hypothetical protein
MKANKIDNWQINLIFVLFIAIYSGQINKNSTGFIDTKMLLYVLVTIYTYILFIKAGNKVTSSFEPTLGLIVLFWFVWFLKFQDFMPLYMIRIISTLLSGYFIAKICGKDFYFLYSEFIYKWVQIVLFVFAIQLLTPNLLFRIIEFIENFIPFLRSTSNSNLGIFVFKEAAPFRNCGFMWEPGAFSMILLPVIIITAILDNYKVKKKLIILIIAELTTVSTSGYVCLLFILFWIIFQNTRKHLLLGLIGVATFMIMVPYFWKLEFVGKEIMHNINQIDNRIDNIYAQNRSYITAGRFTAAVLDFQDWKKNPFFGLGGATRKGITYGKNFIVNRNNGFTDVLVEWGSVGLLIILFYNYRAFKKINNNKFDGIIGLIVMSSAAFSHGGLIHIYTCVLIFLSTNEKFREKSKKIVNHTDFREKVPEVIL